MFPGDDDEGFFEEILEEEVLVRDLSRGASVGQILVDEAIAHVEGEVLDDFMGF